MPFLNYESNLIIYEDSSDKNPKIKLPDITKSIQGVAVSNDKSDRPTLYPNESKSIVVTSRSLNWDSSTELQFLRYLSSLDNIRITYTGTGLNPNFRTARAIGGDATTQVTIARVSAYVARISNVGGTAWTTGTVVPGDHIRFEKDTDAVASPFSDTNKGQTFLVQNVGSTYIDFIDNGSCALDSVTLGSNYAFVLRVFSPGPIKVGDTLSIYGSGINPSNHGKYTIVDVSSDYVEVVNPYAVNETVLYGANNLVIYEYLIGFVYLRSTGPFKIKFDAQTEWAQVDRIGLDGILAGSVRAYSIQAYNDGLEPVTISIQHAAVL